jgi:Mn2+/Fe2+ NRAMP family transporter
MNESSKRRNVLFAFFLALGPAVIVASVVLGPGSILSNSKVGAAYGFSMVWVLLLATGLMTSMVALGARLGVVLNGTMCDELAARTGRLSAVLVGLTIFLICAGFQFGNNLGVLASIDPWLPRARQAEGIGRFLTVSNLILLILNAAIVAFLFGLQKLYKPIERLMMLLVGMMILAFFGNFVYLLLVGGGEPAPAEAASSPAAMAQSGDALIAVLGLIGTTFSIAGAFYQAYLVREKGWGLGDLRQGLIDSVAGISMLGAISLVIMLTAAISFHGRDVQLRTVSDVARQLEPLFGPAAVVLFSLGLFAGAFSSFMVNAMIGGAMLSDGLGLGGKMDSLSTKAFTTVALLLGMLVAIFVPAGSRVGLLVFAQAATVIGLPLLAVTMFYLATRPDLVGERAVPSWMKLAALIGMIVVMVSAYQLGRKVEQTPWLLDNLASWLRWMGW